MNAKSRARQALRANALWYVRGLRTPFFDLPATQHKASHELDLGVATVDATGDVVDFCYDCDDFITRRNGVIVGIDAHAVT